MYRDGPGWVSKEEQRKLHLREHLPKLVSKVGLFPAIPLVILTPANKDWLNAIGPEIPTLWLEAQEGLLDLSSHSKLMIVEDSGHDIHLDQPDLVVDVIRHMIEEVQCE